MRTHAALPVAERRPDGVWRVWFSSRDERNRAQIGAFDLDLAPPARVLRVTPDPIIGLGPLGAFDDAGVTSSWIVQHEDSIYHYYTGWSLGVSVPFYLYVGLAVSRDGGHTFSRPCLAPVLERS